MRIDLTDEERDLFTNIRFDGAGGDDYDAVRTNGDRAADLAERLLARKAIPEVRLRYFTDPELNVGMAKSRQEVFVSNGTKGREILSHPNFLKHLRYFVCGPALPAGTIAAFKKLDERPFREVEQLRQFVRARVRDMSRGDADCAGEEFFKLALECGLDTREAKTLRTDAMSAATAARRHH